MDNQIDAKEILLKDLFDTKFLFEIPGYQRPFAWDEENFDQLFEDIRAAMETKEEAYFLGSVILQIKKSKDDGSAVYDVVDGQQRLTSLTILLAVMRDLIQEEPSRRVLQTKLFQEAVDILEIPEQVRLLVREKDQSFFKKHVLLQDGTLQPVQASQLSESQTHMHQAIQCFRDKFKLDGQVDQALLSEMIKFTLNKCMFVYVRTGSFTSAYRLFAVLNDRGMPLTTSDLLKSTNLGAVPTNERDKCQRIWEAVEEELGRDELDQILAHIRMVWIKEKARKSIVDEYEQIIYAKNDGLKGKAFIEYLEKASDLYKRLVLDAELGSNDPSLDVPYYNLMSLMRDFIGNNDWVPALLSFTSKFTDKVWILKFVRQLEKLIVVDWLRAITPTARIVKMSRIIGIVEKCSTADDVLADTVFDLSSFSSDLAFILDANDIYKRRYTKYLLLRLDLSYVEGKNVVRAYKGVISVEHVLPQNPSADWLRDFDEANRITWTHRLANLVLLSKNKNSAANNRPFQEKVQKYLKTGGITDFEITKDIAKYPDWTVHALTKRQGDLVEQVTSLYV